jgi:hypothetical protein
MSTKDNQIERTQKNLRVLPETAEKLEEMARERYGSAYKQGQVVDELVANEGSGDLLRMVDEMHDVVVSSALGESESTHTTQPEYGADDPAKELERLAKEQGYLVTEEHDLSVLAGARGIDKTAVYIAALRGDNQESVTKAEVRDMIMRDVGLSYNSANQHAQQVTLQLHKSPLSGMEDWVSEAVDECLDANLNAKDGLRRKDNQFKSDFGDSIEDFAGANNELVSTGDSYYLDVKDVVSDAQRDMHIVKVANNNRQYPKSVMTQMVAKEMVRRVRESEILDELNDHVERLESIVTADELAE